MDASNLVSTTNLSELRASKGFDRSRGKFFILEIDYESQDNYKMSTNQGRQLYSLREELITDFTSVSGDDQELAMQTCLTRISSIESNTVLE